MININPNRVRLHSGAPSRSKENARARVDAQLADVLLPKRAHINYVPSPESLRTLISNALDAFRRGISWDRGSILNLLV